MYVFLSILLYLLLGIAFLRHLGWTLITDCKYLEGDSLATMLTLYKTQSRETQSTFLSNCYWSG